MNSQGRIGFIFGMGAVGILVLGVFHIRNLIARPFIPRGAPPPVAVAPPDEPSRTADLDVDGLSDWDEVNVYGTSMYVADTDSDSISDGEEVKQGKNPNCREGTTCGAIKVGVTTDLEAGVPSYGVTPDTQPGPNANTNINDILSQIQSSPSTRSVAPPTFSADLTPDQIRVILERSGIRKEVLVKLSDEQIVKSWREVVAQQKGAALPAPQPINPQELQFQVQRMGTAELVQILTLLGFARVQVDAMSETQLRENVIKALLQAQTP